MEKNSYNIVNCLKLEIKIAFFSTMLAILTTNINISI